MGALLASRRLRLWGTPLNSSALVAVWVADI